MINNVNNQRFKTIHNYSGINKKPTPISILTAENTIFIKTNQNKLASNYISHGNQIKHNKNFLSTTINQSRKFNNSLKNTFSIEKTRLFGNLDKKNLKEIHNKINKFIKTNKFKNKHYRGTNSFIKIDRRNKNNLSSVNTIKGFSSNNHIFNFYNMETKLNNSSIKGKNKIKKELKNTLGNEYNNLNENNKNNFNTTYKITNETSILKQNDKEKTKSNSKNLDNLDKKATFSKKFNYSNNLSNLISINNHYNIYSRTIKSYIDNKREKEKENMLRRKNYDSRKINNKYIYSIEKKKEKSLVEKRQRAKKPISYLIKNNYMIQINNKKNNNKILLNFNNEDKEEKKNINEKISGRNNIEQKLIKFKKNTYNIDNYNFNFNIGKEENNKNKRISGFKTIELNSNNFNKTSSNNENKTKKNNQKNLIKNISNENNNIVNNNYYNINNTFIFDNFGDELSQYNLTKLIAKNKNSSNYIEVNNYNSEIYKTIDTDIERNKNNIIKNLNRKIKNNTKHDKTNNNKLKVNKISNLIKDKMGKNYLQFLTINNNKLYISNVIQKGITIRKDNNNYYTINNHSRITLGKKPINNEKNNEVKHNKERTLNIEGDLNLDNKITLQRKINHNSLYENLVNNKSKNEKYTSKEIQINNIINTSINNFESDSIKIKKIISKNKKDKEKLNADTNNIQKNKLISYKIFNNKKNKSYNIEQLNKLNIKGKVLFGQNKNRNKCIKQKPIIRNTNDNINECEDNNENNNYEENYTIETDKGQKEKKQNSSFELISLSDNNLNEKENTKNDEDFDDINSIIKKIDFNFEINNENDIFSLYNKKYREFNKIFDEKFDKWLKN